MSIQAAPAAPAAATPDAAPNLATALGTEGKPAEGQTAAPTEPPKQESASKAFELIAKEKKRVQEMRAANAAREKALAEREEALKAQESRPSSKPGDPIAALQAAGYSYDDAVQFMLNNQQLTPDQRIKQFEDRIEGRFKAQEEEQSRRAAAEAESAKKAHAQAIEDFQGRIWETIAGDQTKYELSNLEDADDVKNLGYQLADLHFKEHKKVLSESEVADLVEGYLEERVAKLAQAKKIQSRFKPADPAPPAPPEAESKKPATLAAAITNSSAPVYSPAKSEADRLKRAHEALEKLGR